MWCFYHLFGLSFWRHPFTAEDPLVSKWCNATFLQICSDEETNLSTFWMAWGCVHFYHIFMFGWTIPLKSCEHALVNQTWLSVHVAYLWKWKCVHGMYIKVLFFCCDKHISVWFGWFCTCSTMWRCSRWRKIYRTGWREDLHTSNSKLTAGLLHLTRITASTWNRGLFQWSKWHVCLNNY